jgi:hypothetical protein
LISSHSERYNDNTRRYFWSENCKISCRGTATTRRYEDILKECLYNKYPLLDFVEEFCYFSDLLFTFYVFHLVETKEKKKTNK